MKALSKNLLSVFGGDLVRRLLGFLTVAYMARTIGVDGFGLVNFSFTVLSYLIMLSSAGMHIYGTREVAQGRGDGLVGGIFSARLMNGALLYAVLILLAEFGMSSVRERLVVVFVGAAVLPQALSLDWFYQGRERMAVVSAAKAFSAAIFLAVLVVAVHTPEDIVVTGVGSFAGDVISVGLVLLIFLRERIPVRFTFSVADWKRMMESALPMGIGSILAHLSVNFPIIFLGIAATRAEVGLYSAASKVVFFLLIIDRVLGQLLLPASSRLHSVSVDALKSALERTQKWVLLLGLPAAVGGTLLAERLLTVVFGEDFRPAAPAFRLLLGYFFFTLVHTVYTSGVLATGGEHRYKNTMVFSAVSFVLGTIGGYWAAGIAGAAAGVFISEAMTCLVMRAVLQRTIRLAVPTGILQILAGVVLMSVVVPLLRHWGVTVQVVGGAIVYATVIFILKGVTLEEIRYLRAKIV